jgi:hypothetical protein
LIQGLESNLLCGLDQFPFLQSCGNTFVPQTLYQKKVPKPRPFPARFDFFVHNRAMSAKWVFIETVKLKGVPQITNNLVTFKSVRISL